MSQGPGKKMCVVLGTFSFVLESEDPKSPGEWPL